jgi:glycosyltransferase involved in cell wall biosynthesis
VVRARIAALGLGERVLLAGQRRDIAELLAAADLFVLPSVLEGLPLALLEAMAAGTPVVATAVGGVPRVVEDGVTGRLVPAGDAGALAEAMVLTLTQPDLARRLALAGQTRVRETYGADAWARRLQEIYDDAVTGTLSHTLQ